MTEQHSVGEHREPDKDRPDENFVPPFTQDRSPAGDPASGVAGRRGTVLICLFLLALVLRTFLPALRNAFIGFDDPEYVTANVHVRSGLGWENVVWAFRSAAASNWHPLTWISHMLDCQLFGLAPWGHHLTSILLHALNTILVYLVLQRMTGKTWRSFFVAALFGMHPLRVESVAWISERKDVLSTAFWMLTLWAYARYAQKKSEVRDDVSSVMGQVSSGEISASNIQHPTSDSQHPTHNSQLTTHNSPFSFLPDYWFALLFFGLGLMSKPMLVTLPFVLLLLDYWPLNRVPGGRYQVSGIRDQGAGRETPVAKLSDPNVQHSTSNIQHPTHHSSLATPNSRFSTLLPLLVEKIPFFLMAAAVSCVTFAVQRESGAVSTVFPFTCRLENAVVSYCRYLGKLFYPADLAVYYPFPGSWPAAITILACGVLVVISIFTFALRRNQPWLPVGWLWFIGTLVPVIGLVQVGDQAMADRYTYIPSIGILVLGVWGLAGLAGRWRPAVLILPLVGAVLIGVCMSLSRMQIGRWRDSETLFRHALAVTRNNPLAHDNLGTALSEQGRIDESIIQYREALRLKPDFAEAHSNLGGALQKKGQFKEAISHLLESIRLKPGLAEEHYNLGGVLVEAGWPEPGIAEYRAALKLKPGYADARYNLANTLNRIGQSDEAILQYLELLKLDARYAEAHYNLGVVFCSQGRWKEGSIEFQSFLRQRPDSAAAHMNLGMILDRQGLLSEAAGEYLLALRLRPDDAQTHFNLGKTFERQGRFQEAIGEFRLALKWKPDDVVAQRGLEEALNLKKRMEQTTVPAKP